MRINPIIYFLNHEYWLQDFEAMIMFCKNFLIFNFATDSYAA